MVSGRWKVERSTISNHGRRWANEWRREAERRENKGRRSGLGSGVGVGWVGGVNRWERGLVVDGGVWWDLWVGWWDHWVVVGWRDEEAGVLWCAVGMAGAMVVGGGGVG